MELILRYFPDLTAKQQAQLTALGDLYRHWNEKINVISRKDIDHLYAHHVLHSLTIARYDPFNDGMQVLDAGTGGGFPGIPLAIVYPGVQFTLLDATAKKIHVVEQVAAAIQLENVTAIHARLESHTGQFDIVMSRAVSSLGQLVSWSKHLMPVPRWIALKGGSPEALRKELPPFFKMTCIPVSRYFEGEYFLEKYILDVCDLI